MCTNLAIRKGGIFLSLLQKKEVTQKGEGSLRKGGGGGSNPGGNYALRKSQHNF